MSDNTKTNRTTRWTSIVVCICTILGLIGSGFIYINKTYAKDEKVKEMKQTIQKLNKRLDVFITNDKISNLQERVWKIKDRHPDAMPVTAKEEIRRLEHEIHILENSIKTGE